jgi:hypothetical protein
MEGNMSADLQFLEEWIPERMDPGTVFVLENQTKMGMAQNPFVAVMSCPRCGTMGRPNTGWTARPSTSAGSSRRLLPRPLDGKAPT